MKSIKRTKKQWTIALLGTLLLGGGGSALAQVAAPLINSNSLHTNPAAAAWRKISNVNVGLKSLKGEIGKPKVTDTTITEQTLQMAVAGEIGAVEAGIEYDKYTFSGVDFDFKVDQTQNKLSLGATTEFVAIGVGASTVDQESKRSLSSYEVFGKGKVNTTLMGISLKLGSLYLGALQNKVEKDESKYIYTGSNSGTYTFPALAYTESTSAIGVYVGDKSDTRFHLEAIQTTSPEVKETKDGYTSSNDKSETITFVGEAQFGGVLLGAEVTSRTEFQNAEDAQSWEDSKHTWSRYTVGLQRDTGLALNVSTYTQEFHTKHKTDSSRDSYEKDDGYVMTLGFNF